MLGVIVVGREIEIVLAELEAEFLRRRLQHAHALRHDLLADAVAGNDGDAVDAVGGGHGKVLLLFAAFGGRLARIEDGCQARSARRVTSAA